MNRERLAYSARTHAENQLSKGYRILVDKESPHADDVDDDRMSDLLKAVDSLINAKVPDDRISSIYVVGFGLGELLVNIRLLHGGALWLGGCEQSDIFISFGQNLFDLNSYDLNLEVKEPPYHEIPETDLMISIDYLTDTPEGRDTLKMMQSKSRYLIVCEKEMQQYLGNKVELQEAYSFQVWTGKSVKKEKFKFEFKGEPNQPLRGQRVNDIIVDEWEGTDDE